MKTINKNTAAGVSNVNSIPALLKYIASFKTKALALVLLLAFLGGNGKAWGQTTIWTEDFGSTNYNLTTSSTPWRSLGITSSANYLRIQGNNGCTIDNKSLIVRSSSACTYNATDDAKIIAYNTTAINASTYYNLTIDFQWKGTGEVGWSYYDYWEVVICPGASSPTTAGNWSVVGTGKYAGSTTTQSVSNLAIPPSFNNTSFYIGFRWTNDNSAGGDNVQIDNVAIKGSLPLPGENCSNAQDLSTLTSPFSGTTTGYTNDYSSPCAFGNSSQDRVFYIDVANGSTITIGQTVNGYDSENTVFYGGSCPGATQIACFDDPDVQNIVWTNSTGTTQRVYWVQDGYGNSFDNGSFTLVWSLTAPPPANPTSISVAETSGTANDGTICNGSSATITANGTVGTVYWFTGSCATTGQIGTGNSLSVSPTTTTTYYARNFSGGQWSTSCASTTITVNSAPTNVNAGADVSICLGNSTQLSGGAIGSLSPPEVLFTEGFETSNSIFPPSGWVSFRGVNLLGNAQDWDGGAVYANSGNYAALSVYENVTGGLAEDWLVTSQINLTGYTNTTLSFSYSDYYTTNYSSELIVKVSSNSQTSHSDFTTIDTFSEPGGAYTQTTLDLSAYDGQSIYIAFIHINDNGDVIYLDDISVSAQARPVTYSWLPTTNLNASNIANPLASPVSGITYTMTATSNGCSATDDVTITVSNPTLSPPPVANDKIWRGANTDWATASNWYDYDGSSYSIASTIPTGADNVIIPATQACISNAPTCSSGSHQTNALTIESGATFTMSGGTLSIAGDYTNNGIFNSGSAGVIFNGSTDQNVTSGGSSFANVTLNNTSSAGYEGIVLQDAMTVNGALTFTDGNIQLGVNDLTIGASGTVVTPSATSHVITASSGVVTKNTLGATEFTFPVGTSISSYTPIKLANSGTADNFSVYVTDDVLDGGTTGSIYNTGRVAKTWHVSESTVGGSSVTMTPYWTVVDEDAQFDRTVALVSHWDGSAWDMPIEAPAQSSGSLYYVSRSGLSSFSPFMVQRSSFTPLPITLSYFGGTCNPEGNEVMWVTSSEQNSSHFDLKRSYDGMNWEHVGQKQAAGNSATDIEYVIWDVEGSRHEVTYYELRQFDYNNDSEVFGPIAVRCENIDSDINGKLSPNPTLEASYLAIENCPLGEATITLMSSTGQIVYTDRIMVTKKNDVYFIDSLDLTRGSYVVRFQAPNGQIVAMKLVKN